VATQLRGSCGKLLPGSAFLQTARRVNPGPAGRIQSTNSSAGWVPRADHVKCLNPPEQGKGERLSTVGKRCSPWTNIQHHQSNAELLSRGSQEKSTLLVPVRAALLSRALLLYQQPAPRPSPWGLARCPQPWTPPVARWPWAAAGSRAHPGQHLAFVASQRNHRPRHGRRNSSSVQLPLAAETSLPALRLEARSPVQTPR